MSTAKEMREITQAAKDNYKKQEERECAENAKRILKRTAELVSEIMPEVMKGIEGVAEAGVDFYEITIDGCENWEKNVKVGAYNKIMQVLESEPYKYQITCENKKKKNNRRDCLCTTHTKFTWTISW